VRAPSDYASMPFLNLVHVRELRCKTCIALLAPAGARSFIVDAEHNPAAISVDDPAAQIVVRLTCPNGHVTVLTVPNDVAAEEALMTPDNAPIAVDACIASSGTQSREALP
jgi:hypothetical protein